LPDRSRKPVLAEDMGEKGGDIPLMINVRYTFYDWCFIDKLLKPSLKMFLLRASDDTNYASDFENSPLIGGGSFAGSTSLILDTSAAVGKTIRIHLSAGGTGRSRFDNIRLDGA